MLRRGWKARSETDCRRDTGRCVMFPDLGRAPALIEPARSQIVFVPAQIVTELVEIRETNLLAKRIDVFVGKIPETFEIKEDLRRRRIVVGQLGADGIAREEAEDVGLETFGED